MGKLFIFGLIIVTIWFFFFRKNKKKLSTKKNEEIKNLHDMVECESCGTFSLNKDAIFANNKWYCSKECLINKDKQ